MGSTAWEGLAALKPSRLPGQPAGLSVAAAGGIAICIIGEWTLQSG